MKSKHFICHFICKPFKTKEVDGDIFVCKMKKLRFREVKRELEFKPQIVLVSKLMFLSTVLFSLFLFLFIFYYRVYCEVVEGAYLWRGSLFGVSALSIPLIGSILVTFKSLT